MISTQTPHTPFRLTDVTDALWLTACRWAWTAGAELRKTCTSHAELTAWRCFEWEAEMGLTRVGCWDLIKQLRAYSTTNLK